MHHLYIIIIIIYKQQLKTLFFYKYIVIIYKQQNKFVGFTKERKQS